MTIYIGPAGSLQALPYMGRGIGASIDLGAAVQRALGGPRTVDYIGAPKRVYSLSRDFLTGDELSILEGLALGAYGDGPLVLLDPWRRNQLAANQATAGDTSRSTAGGRPAGTGAVLSVAASATTAQGAYQWRFQSASSGAASTSRLEVVDSTSLTVAGGVVPVRALAPYTFSASLLHVSGTAAAWQAGIFWIDSALGLISSDVGTGAVVTAAWSQRVVTATAPGNAAYAYPFIGNSATLAAVNTIAVDALQLEQASAATPWVIGTGVPRVAFTDLSDSYPLGYQHDVAFALQEIG